MYITNVTDDYDNSILCNCTNNENNIDIFIPALLFTIPCGLSFLCLISLMVYTLIKPFFQKRIIVVFVKYKWRSFFIQLIQLGVYLPDLVNVANQCF